MMNHLLRCLLGLVMFGKAALAQQGQEIWNSLDIGSVGIAGSASYADATGVFTIRASGNDIWNSADGFHYVYRELTGDGQIVALVNSVQNTSSWAKAGVMMRESLAAGSKHISMVVSPGSGVSFQRRFATGGGSVEIGVSKSAPYWVKLVRQGGVFSGYCSVNGVDWQLLQQSQIDMGAMIYVGLAVTAHNNDALCAATFDQVEVLAGNGLPDWWQTHYFGQTGLNAQAPAPSGNGLTILQAYQSGCDPNDYYSQPGGTVTPQLLILGGNHQTGAPGQFLAQPLKVRVSDSLTGLPLVNAPVTFSVTQGGGKLALQPSPAVAQYDTLTVRTDGSGCAQVDYLAAADHGMVSASTGGGQQADFEINISSPTVGGHWPFDEQSGVIAHEAGGHGGLDAHLTGSTHLGAAGFDGGGAVQLTGRSAMWIDNAGHQLLPDTGQPFSIEFWFKADELSAGQMHGLMCNESYSQSGFRLGIDNGGYQPNRPATLCFWTSESGGNFGADGHTRLEAQTWYHVLISCDGGAVKIFLNGALEASGTGRLVGNTNRLSIGESIGGYAGITGRLDNLKIYPLALTQTEAQAGYNADSDGNGLPDWWEWQHFGQLGIDPNAQTPAGNGLTNRQAYEHGLNPNDYYSQLGGQVVPQLVILSGNNQTSAEGQFAPEPLIVRVTDSLTGLPLVNAPLTFSVTQGGGKLSVQPSLAVAYSATLTVRTAGGGLAWAYYLQPSGQGVSSTITASAGTGWNAIFNVFTNSQPISLPSAVINLTAYKQENGSVLLNWVNTATNATGILVQRRDSGGDWQHLATLAPMVTTYTDNTFKVSHAPVQSIMGTFVLAPVGSPDNSQFGLTAFNQAGNGPAAITTTQSGGAGNGTGNNGHLPDEEPPQPEEEEPAKPSYAIIDLGATDSVGEPKGVNDSGQVLLVNGTIGQLWAGGQLQSIGASGTFMGPVRDGTVYYLNATATTTYGEDGKGHIKTTRQLADNHGGQRMGLVSYSGSASCSGTIYYGDLSGVVGTAANQALTAEAQKYPNAAPYKSWYESSWCGEKHSASLTAVNDEKVFMYQGSLGYSSHSGDSHMTADARGWQDVMLPVRSMNWESDYSGSMAVSREEGMKKSFLLANQHDFGIYDAGSGSNSGMYYHYGEKEEKISESGTVGDLNSVSGHKGPYILGQSGGVTKVWAYNGGAVESITLAGTPGRNESGVVGRKISNELVVPLGDSIWKGNKKKWEEKNQPDGNLYTTTEITGSNANWQNINVTLVSPKYSLLVGTANKNGQLRSVLLVPAALAVDADHDGYIKYFENQNKSELKNKKLDITSKDKPFQFWINNDYDGEHEVDGYDILGIIYIATDKEEDDLQVGYPDHNYNDIRTRRDLEDYTRLWINAWQVIESMGGADGLTAEMEWQPIEGNNWATLDGAPAIKLFKAVEQDGGNKYLSEQEGASKNQIQGEYKTALGEVAKGNKFTFPANYFSGLSKENPCKYFIFEGVRRGKGKLMMRFKKDSFTVELPPLYLELKDIKEFYENWTVGDGNVEPSQTVSLLQNYSTGFGNNEYHASFQYPVPQKEEEEDYVLFVHGWNMPDWEKERYAETMYKRLWHQGYKGRMGIFRWPCLTDNGFALTDSDYDGKWRLTFDKSEFRAWKSAQGLLDLLHKLNSGGYQNKVRILAHSQGNVVATEALRLANHQNLVHTYVATQAAIAAHCYDPTTPALLHGTSPPFYFTTPNVYARYWEQGQNAQLVSQWSGTLRSYAHIDYLQGTANKFVNFYNIDDYALAKWPHWETTQRLKPNTDYDYTSTLGFHKGSLLGATGLKFPTDRYEIFSFAAEAQSKALGAQGGVKGIFAQRNDVYQNDLQANYGFNGKHIFHSGQFRSSIAARWNYWKDFIEISELKKGGSE